MGRLFDAVASFCGVKHKINYEAQAAIELEALIDTSELGTYSIENLYQEPDGDIPRIIGVFNLIRNIIDDVIYQVPTPKISAKFHNTVINLVVDNSIAIRNLAGLNDVVLSGGVWQNNYLVSHTIQRLMQENFQVHTHHIVPPNDGGISLGQAVIASTYLSRLRSKVRSTEILCALEYPQK